MRLLPESTVRSLAPYLWRTWKPGKYNREIWWKLEDLLDISDVIEERYTVHKISKEPWCKTQYIPFGKIILRRLRRSKSRISKRMSSKITERKCKSKSKEDFIDFATATNVKCLHLACSRGGNKFVTIDTYYNLYYFDIDSNVFWWVMSCPGSVVLSFCDKSMTELLVGNKNGRLDKINVTEKNINGRFTEHVYPVTIIRFGPEEVCLSYSRHEAWIWNHRTFQVLHTLVFKRRTPPIAITFIPGREHLLLTVLSDASFYLWSREEGTKCPRMYAAYLGKEFMMEDSVTCVDFSPDGNLMALAGKRKLISIVDTKSTYWTVSKVLQLPMTAHSTKTMAFLNIPVHTSSAVEKDVLCLAVFTLPRYELIIYNTERKHYTESGSPVCRMIDVELSPIDFQLIPYENKYAIFRLENGFVDVYTTFWWLNDLICPWLHFTRPLPQCRVRVKPNLFPALKEKPTVFPSTNLGIAEPTGRGMYRYILSQDGVLPPSERKYYWKLALCVPGNETAFRKLIDLGIHPACQRLFDNFPQLTKESLFLLTRVLSCFYYHSPIFFLVEHFPKVLLQFCRIFNWGIFGTFEVLLTVFENFCYLWYESFPCISKSIAKIIDTSLAKNDRQLYEHLKSNGLSPAVIGWNLLTTFFTEALDLKSWLHLWDHIIFADRKFIITVAVSLILNNREIFLKLTGDYRNVKYTDVNIGSVILMAYDLHYEKCNDDIPFGQMNFDPLPKREVYREIRMKLDKSVIDREVRKKLDERIVKDIKLEEKFDLYRLLDPRLYQKVPKPETDCSHLDLSSDTREEDYSENEELFQSNELIIKDFEGGRKKKIKQLQYLLEKYELHWIKGDSFRLIDRCTLAFYNMEVPKLVKVVRTKDEATSISELYLQEYSMTDVYEENYRAYRSVKTGLEDLNKNIDRITDLLEDTKRDIRIKKLEMSCGNVEVESVEKRRQVKVYKLEHDWWKEKTKVVIELLDTICMS